MDSFLCSGDTNIKAHQGLHRCWGIHDTQEARCTDSSPLGAKHRVSWANALRVSHVWCVVDPEDDVLLIDVQCVIWYAPWYRVILLYFYSCKGLWAGCFGIVALCHSINLLLIPEGKPANNTVFLASTSVISTSVSHSVMFFPLCVLCSKIDHCYWTVGDRRGIFIIICIVIYGRRRHGRVTDWMYIVHMWRFLCVRIFADLSLWKLHSLLYMKLLVTSRVSKHTLTISYSGKLNFPTDLISGQLVFKVDASHTDNLWWLLAWGQS